jgi:hypothetical protein
MRAFLASISLAGACLALASCESELPPNPPSASGVNKFERGISGKGSLNEPDKSDDPVIRENTRVGD